MAKKIDEKNIIEQGGSKKEFSSNSLQAYAQENIEKFVNEKLNNLEEKMNDKIDRKETKTTEILAIFITLFTFISVNVNIFTRVQDIQSAVWFMLLFTLCSLLLLSCLFMTISSKKNYYIIGILVLSMLFLVGLLVATKYIPSWNVSLNGITENQQQTIKIIK